MLYEARVNMLSTRRCRLVLITIVFAFSLNRVYTDLFVVLLEGSHVFTGLAELTLFHTLADIPVDESPFGVHEVELVVQSCPGFGDSSSVAKHANSTLHLCQITAWHNCRWLVVDADLETSRAPIDKLNGSLGLDRSNGRVDVLRHNVTTVEQAARHVLSVSRVAFHHLIGRLKASVGDLGNSELLMVCFLSR